jgi:hypothetical protein
MVGQDREDLAVRFTIRTMTIAIAVLAVILALAVQVPWLLVAGGDAILVGFGIYKLGRALALGPYRPEDETPWPPVWLSLAVAVILAVVVLGLLIGCS